MKTLKYAALILGLAALVAPSAKAAMVDFHLGSVNQTGPAVYGNAGDIWNMANSTNGGPLYLKDVTGATTPISVTWTSGNAGAASKSIYVSASGTPMDAGTSWLMNTAGASYAYGPSTATNLSFTINGLAHSAFYSLVIYGAGEQSGQGGQYTVSNGTSLSSGSISGYNRLLSKGPGNAYTVIPCYTSVSGALYVTGSRGASLPYAMLNGFQLVQGTLPAPAAASIKTTLTPLTWGVIGHPTWGDYSSWIPADLATQMNDVKSVGATYYRVSFESEEYTWYMGSLEPAATAAGVTLLPILPISLVAANSATVNYNNNYQIGYSWASYAIAHGFSIPVWELGNEVETWNLVDVAGDGSMASQITDATPGGFVAIASGFNGAYQGIKDAYTAGRAAKLTTMTPQVLIGATYHHWGLLAKIQTYNKGVLPCDALSWHWYGPSFGSFNTVITDVESAGYGRTPALCLGDFRSKTNPSQPMDIWMTETNRMQTAANGTMLNGSVASNSTPTTSQDWAAEATAIQNNIDGMKPVASVKAIFVYELYDDTKYFAGNTSALASEGYFGLITGLNGTKKNAFYTYQTEIKAGR